MKKLAILAVAGLSVAACTPQERVAGGALVGGAAGAGIGAAVTDDAGGAIAGGILGAGAGALAGAATADQYCTSYDSYGRAYQYRC